MGTKYGELNVAADTIPVNKFIYECETGFKTDKLMWLISYTPASRCHEMYGPAVWKLVCLPCNHAQVFASTHLSSGPSLSTAVTD